MVEDTDATHQLCNYPAHIRRVGEGYEHQSVAEHCRQVADYAAISLRSVGLCSTGYLAGLLHDMGKNTSVFRDYIEKASRNEPVVRGSVNHTFASVIYLLERYHVKEKPDMSTLTCEILAFAVGSHHGEFDCVDLEKVNGFDHRLFKDKNSIYYTDAVDIFLKSCASEEDLDRLFKESVTEIERIFVLLKDRCGNGTTAMTFVMGRVARLVLSSIIDADRRDTAEFMMNRPITPIRSDSELWTKIMSRVDDKMSGFKADTPINEARAFFSKTCFQEGQRHPYGIFRLTLPTGAGKTLSSLGYALANAQQFNKKRIVFVIPLLSILEQNSAVIRKYIDDDQIVLEHHSNFIKEFNDKDELDEYELLTDTWDSPIIVTTLVQLLNTLFSGKTSSIRRMSALTDSVLIIDEVQSLPKKTLYMFNLTLNFLAYVCGATIILSSATQPVFDNVEFPIRFSDSRDIIPFDPIRNAIFKRTTIHDVTCPFGMNIEGLTDFCRQKFEEVQSMLIICNTKSSAAKVFEQLKLAQRDTKIFHLSASMCMKHRIDTLQEIMKYLGRKEKMICVSTQLVEAGVDFSFQRVIRVLAGMDSIAQAAGRCNRSGDFGMLCDVFIVNLKPGDENLNMLKEIYASQRSTQALLQRFGKESDRFDGELISEMSIQTYYENLFNDPEIKGQFEYTTKDSNGDERRLFRLLSTNGELLDRKNTPKYFLNQSFKTAGHLFEVFDENTTDILVPYDDKARQIISELLSEKRPRGIADIAKLTEQAKPYLIHIFEYQKRRLSDDGMLYPDPSGRFMILNELCYSRELGLKNGDVFL